MRQIPNFKKIVGTSIEILTGGSIIRMHVLSARASEWDQQFHTHCFGSSDIKRGLHLRGTIKEPIITAQQGAVSFNGDRARGAFELLYLDEDRGLIHVGFDCVIFGAQYWG